uniref:Protein kinase domain-containing protein n=1 Tax=Setaria italica TaxID=4555 RepID=K3XQP1_SETIT
MAAKCFSGALHLLPLFLLLPVTTKGATLSITNQCSYTVWPAAVPVGGGVQLNPGKSWTIDMESATRGSVWPRTGCSFDFESTGKGSCKTGDCGGMLTCTSKGQPPLTLAEFNFGGFGPGGTDVFDISLVDGFNVPMDLLPVPAKGQGEQGCSKGPHCAANITPQCPQELKAPGGCNNACTVFKQDKYCCNGSSTCEPTNYSGFFKRMCPEAFSYALDTSDTTFTCPSGTNYQLIDRDKSQVITRMRGTPGYLAPEWLTSQITEKADIYSFGVVVMEMISGRKNLDTSQSEESIHLITLLEEKVKSDELADLIEKDNTDMRAHREEILEMMKLAMWCLQIDSKRRPQMSEVIKVLEGDLDAESKIEHNFVATSQTMFGIAGNTDSSDPPQASNLSAPR